MTFSFKISLITYNNLKNSVVFFTNFQIHIKSQSTLQHKLFLNSQWINKYFGVFFCFVRSQLLTVETNKWFLLHKFVEKHHWNNWNLIQLLVLLHKNGSYKKKIQAQTMLVSKICIHIKIQLIKVFVKIYYGSYD